MTKYVNGSKDGQLWSVARFDDNLGALVSCTI
jgi:hypothetical protein